MAERIASGEIYIEVNDREAIASLHRIDAAFEREMAKIDRQKATAKLDADLKPLERDLKQAEAKVKEYQKRIDESDNARSKAQLKRRQEEARADEAYARTRLNNQRKEADAQKAVNKEQDLTEKRLAAISKREQQIERVREQAAKREQTRQRQKLAGIDQEARRRASLEKQRVRELRQDERSYQNLKREQQAVPQLEARYAQLHDRLEKLAMAKRKAGKDEHAKFTIDLQERQTIGEIHRIRDRVRAAVKRDPILIPVKPVIGRRAGENLRHDFLANGGRLDATAAAVGLRVGRTLGSKIATGYRAFDQRGISGSIRSLGSGLSNMLGRGAAAGVARIGRAFDSLANLTVRLGPFTATIRQLMLVMSLLGPTVIDVAGALGSLVSVVGSASAGLGALGVAIAGGAIPAAIGFVSVLKPVVGEVKNAMTASKAYNKAVLEHGKNSQEAAKKLEVFKNVMKGQSDETRKNFLAAGKLKDAWAKATAPARANTFKLMGQGLSFLTKNVDFFGKRTNATFAAVQGGLSRWLKGLSSAEGHNILGTMMDNFNASLRPAIDGVGNLLAVWGRFGASASRFMPGFAKQFRDWSKGLLDSSKNAGTVNGKVDRMMASLKSVGRFLLAGGRLMQAFFGGGVTAGQKFTDTMTNAMNRWTAFLRTGQGQSSLHSFFDRAVAGAESLWGALAPIAKTFVQWSNAISPIATAFFKGAAAVGNFVNGVLKVTALRGPLTALAATLGALWAVGKIGAATLAVANFGRALMGVKAAQTGLAATGALGGAGGAGGLLGGVGGARTAANETKAVANALGQTASKGKVARSAIAGFATGLTGIPAPALAVVGAVVAIEGAMVALDKAFDISGKRAGERIATLEKTALAAGDGMARSNTRFMAARDAMEQYGSEVVRTNLTLKAARGRLADAKKGTDEYRLAQLDVRDALREHIRAQIDLQKASNSYRTAAKNGIQNALAAKRANDAEIAGLRKKVSQGGPLQAVWQHQLDIALKRQKQLGPQAEAAWNRVAAAPIQAGRALKGMVALTGQAEQSLGRLSRTAGGKKIATKIGFQYEDPRKAAKVGAAARQALNRGAGSAKVMKIVANSKNAEDAIKRLNRLKLNTKNLNVKLAGEKLVENALNAIQKHPLPPKTQKISDDGGRTVLGTLGDIARFTLGTATKNIGQRGGGPVRSILSAIRGFRLGTSTKGVRVDSGQARAELTALQVLNDLGTAVKTIVTHYKTTGKHPYTGGVMAHATGGPTGTIEAHKTGAGIVERAARAAANKQVEKAVAGKHATPTFLVGEEGRTEYVIATNPAYRDRNRNYVLQAAADLGMLENVRSNGTDPKTGLRSQVDKDGNPVIVAAVTGMGSTGSRGYGISDDYTNRPGIGLPFRVQQGSLPQAPPPKPSYDKTSRGRERIKDAADNWTYWLNQIHRGQSMLTREAARAQNEASSMPDNWITETVTTDPVTGEPHSSFAIDEGAKKTWDDKLADARNWYDTLLNWIETEMAQLDDAWTAFDNEADAGQRQIDDANSALPALNKLRGNYEKELAHLQKKKKKTGRDKKRIKTLQTSLLPDVRGRIGTWENEKTQGSGWIAEGNSRKKEVVERTAEIGYDYRDFIDQRNDIESSRAGIPGVANIQLRDANAGNYTPPGSTSGGGGGSGGGSGGGTSEVLSYGAQGMLADTERANVLRDFGGNANPNVGNLGGPSSPGVLASGQSNAVFARGSGSSQAAAQAIGAVTPSGAPTSTGVATSSGSVAASALAGLSRGSYGIISGGLGGPGGSGGLVVGGGGATEVHLHNNFQFQPGDPTTWSRGAAFDLRSAL